MSGVPSRADTARLLATIDTVAPTPLPPIESWLIPDGRPILELPCPGHGTNHPYCHRNGHLCRLCGTHVHTYRGDTSDPDLCSICEADLRWVLERPEVMRETEWCRLCEDRSNLFNLEPVVSVDGVILGRYCPDCREYIAHQLRPGLVPTWDPEDTDTAGCTCGACVGGPAPRGGDLAW